MPAGPAITFALCMMQRTHSSLNVNLTHTVHLSNTPFLRLSYALPPKIDPFFHLCDGHVWPLFNCCCLVA
jgi:hypothetical protein